MTPAQAIRLASCDPIASHRRELIERNQHLMPAEPRKPLSAETQRRLMLAGIGAGSREQRVEPQRVDWSAMRARGEG